MCGGFLMPCRNAEPPPGGGVEGRGPRTESLEGSDFCRLEDQFSIVNPRIDRFLIHCAGITGIALLVGNPVHKEVSEQTYRRFSGLVPCFVIIEEQDHFGDTQPPQKNYLFWGKA